MEVMSEPRDASVVLINVFELPDDEVDTFVAEWRERAEIMSKAPGFRDSRLHRALSPGTRFPVVNIAHWESRAAWEAAVSNPDFQRRVREQRAVSAHPALYEVIVELEPR
jgi:heme-degrading monooxygenase HmoA